MGLSALLLFPWVKKDTDSWFSVWAGIKNDAVQSLSLCSFPLQAEGKINDLMGSKNIKHLQQQGSTFLLSQFFYLLSCSFSRTPNTQICCRETPTSSMKQRLPAKIFHDKPYINFTQITGLLSGQNMPSVSNQMPKKKKKSASREKLFPSSNIHTSHNCSLNAMWSYTHGELLYINSILLQ